MSDRFSLVQWRDAKTDPPERMDGLYQTDTGFWHYHDGRWVSESSDGLFSPAWPRPSVWCDPSPPGDDALTVEQLRRVCDLARVGNAEVWAHSGHPDTDQFKTEDTQDIDRLRRAIEEDNRE